MTKRDIVVFLFKWYRTLLFNLLLVVGMVTARVYVLPPAYSARAVVLIESTQAISTRFDPTPGIDMSIVLKTESEVLLSRPVLENVVDTVRPHEIPPRRTWIYETKKRLRGQMENVGLLNASLPRDSWIRGLADDIKVKPIAGSNIVEVKYSNEDPRLAAAIVNEVTHAYIAHHAEIYAARGVTEFYDEQAQKSKAKIDELNRQLDNYRATLPVSETAASRDSLNRTLDRLRDQASRLRGEIIELTSKYGEGYTSVKVARSKLADIATAIQTDEDKIARMQSRDAELDLMHSLADAERTNYLNILKLSAQARTTELANPNTTNVRVVEYANIAASPTHSRLFYIVLAVIGGGGLALALALLREYFDQRVPSTDAAEVLLGLPVLGVIPEHKVRLRSTRRA